MNAVLNKNKKSKNDKKKKISQQKTAVIKTVQYRKRRLFRKSVHLQQKLTKTDIINIRNRQIIEIFFFHLIVVYK